tara:strand:- start:6039 stop:6305 length:267 start_codon:yes stop_codon:yes gene_type:complete
MNDLGWERGRFSWFPTRFLWGAKAPTLPIRRKNHDNKSTMDRTGFFSQFRPSYTSKSAVLVDAPPKHMLGIYTFTRQVDVYPGLQAIV